jgi:hypothetical protein
MDFFVKEKLQQRISQIKPMYMSTLHSFDGVPGDFRPWESGLSPSALYNCSVSYRKKMKYKTPEVKWMSIKRWVTVTPEGISLPNGVYLSIKRREKYHSGLDPHFEKIEYILLMFPYGNVWSQVEQDVPITEEWMWSESDGELMFEKLMNRDAAIPIQGYFKSAYNYMIRNPDQIGIHLKRQKQQTGDGC